MGAGICHFLTFDETSYKLQVTQCFDRHGCLHLFQLLVNFSFNYTISITTDQLIDLQPWHLSIIISSPTVAVSQK